MSSFCFKSSPVIMAAAVVAAACGMPQQATAETSQVMFSYQGRVKVGGKPFNGTGQFKFAIINTAGSATLWSNDGTSELSSPPAASIPLLVQDGVFSVMMGDPQANMQPISPTIFQTKSPLRLRVWFDDGENGFQQLNPDHKLTNLTLTTLETGDKDFTIYVNGTTGDDAENGLTAETAKKTIQAAIDTLPDRIKCNVTIDIADGVYPESVRIFGMSVEPGKKLALVGDETWTAPATVAPAVQITGQDTAVADAPKLRTTGIHVIQSSGIELRGLEAEGFQKMGLHTEDAIMDVYNCRFTNNDDGVFAVAGSYVSFNASKADNNELNGFYIGRQSSSHVRGCIAEGNKEAGFRANSSALFNFAASSASKANGVGLLAQHHSSLVFATPVTVTQNTQYGLMLSMLSYTENDQINTFSGNGNGNQPYVYSSYRYNF